MISPAGKEEEEGMQYALASFFFLPPYAEKDEHGNQSGANNKEQKKPLKKRTPSTNRFRCNRNQK